jgi:hypothetical protein
MAISHRRLSLLAVGLLGCAAVQAEDLIDLVGVRPGEVLTAVARNRSVAEELAPFVWFSVPTRLPALADLFPSGDLHALRDGTVFSVSWHRAYLTAEECVSVAASARELLRPYFPVEETGEDSSRYQFQSSDGSVGAGISCRPNEGGYHNVMVEIVHFASDKKLIKLFRAR